MAGANDKARFLQEQSVPELQEYARKKIFTQEEVASIARKRSNFEHILNARESKPQDYARYTEFEMNLESLRRKRIKRLGVKVSNHTAHRRISFLLDRATNRFPGDIAMWMQYITFAQKQGSNKKVSQLLTRVLRLHPTKPELWIHAAATKAASMTEARSYMQRGLRLCGSSEKLWIEYARLEMIHDSKVARRRRILGLYGESVQEKSKQNSEHNDKDIITLPALTIEDDMAAQRPREGAEPQLQELSTGPAVSGAITMAIFDAARAHFKHGDEYCQRFFDMVTEFHELPYQQSILSRIIDIMRSIAPKSPMTLIRWIQQPVTGIDVTSPDFPALFGRCLDRMNKSFETLAPISTEEESEQPLSILGKKVIAWLLSYQTEDLDADVRRVMEITVKRWSQC